MSDDESATARREPCSPRLPPLSTHVTDKVGQVRLADQTVTLAALRNAPDRYTWLFVRARSEIGYAVCLCRTDDVVRLVIRCRSGRYHLATWPDSGTQHTNDCPWYRSHSSLSGRSTIADAIVVSDEGTTIRLSLPLTVRPASTGPTSSRAMPRATNPATTVSRRSVGLLPLLHYLWESSQLNVWHPRRGQRGWRDCVSSLTEQMADCQINQQDLATVLWIVPPFQRVLAASINTAWERFLAQLTSSRHARHRGLVLGEIRSVSPTEYGVRIQLAHQRSPLFATSSLWDRVRRSYPAVFSKRADQSTRRQITLCAIERSPRGYPTVVDMAAMLTTTSYIPADSSHEVKMADALASAGRSFIKPLRYGGSMVFPDFVLTDDSPETYVEVWGVRGRESYEARKRAKQTFYRSSGKTLLEWDVRGPLPCLELRT